MGGWVGGRTYVDASPGVDEGLGWVLGWGKRREWCCGHGAGQALVLVFFFVRPCLVCVLFWVFSVKGGGGGGGRGHGAAAVRGGGGGGGGEWGCCCWWGIIGGKDGELHWTPRRHPPVRGIFGVLSLWILWVGGCVVWVLGWDGGRGGGNAGLVQLGSMTCVRRDWAPLRPREIKACHGQTLPVQWSMG